MGIYRKIDTRIWNDAKFRSLSPNGKLAFLFILTNLNMTALGAMRATVEGLSAELRVPAEAFHEVFGDAFPEGYAEGSEKVTGGLVVFDPEAGCLFVPNFVRYQAAESPNVIKAWAKTLEYIPECGLKTLAVSSVKAYVEGLGEGFRKAFTGAFREALREGIGESVNSEQRTVNIKPVHANRKREAKKHDSFDAKSFLLDKEIPDQVASDWLALRKEKRAYPTQTAIEGIEQEANKAGITLAEALSICCVRGWQSFKADWGGVGNATSRAHKSQSRENFNNINYGEGVRSL